ncbi:molybdopterin molybdotransferase [Sporomusaceae bacterium BoRhaA]|uniref:molybdopterin molybdotransferase MoeA n=1 Tax=Pelorhabdus rhamnosifermentans TaxID=2772457 RepID=UPI001C05F5D7|nr:gephyrin-like molybdotransferase Glp [Pelorhabdus rhamnosifermentans]MBU2702360.1 molybdopterin molybdotransferase [Pelorhabdus rhamnosifermentans]
MKSGVSMEEAQSLLLDQVTVVDTGVVSLLQANGRVVSRKICSMENVPPFDRSPLDGYALKAADTQGATPEHPVKLNVIEEIRAGFAAKKKVTPGTAIKLMTGAPMPAGADVVIKYEAVKREENDLFVSEQLQSGSNVVLAGEDVVNGEVIVQPGELITPPLVGLLAAIGAEQIPVYNKVKIAIFSTGDELVNPGEALSPGKIHNSNLHSLGARCFELGAEPIYGGIVGDELEKTATKLRKALTEADIVITTGGVSVGDFDLVPKALQHIDADVIFRRVKMKPGSPMMAAKKDHKLLIGLSGNPAAAFITFDLLVVPVIKKMMGLRQVMPLTLEAVLDDPFEKSSPQRRFLRGRLKREYVGSKIQLTGKQTNGVLKSMIGCDVLVDVPAGSGPLVCGQKVSALLL